MTTKSDDMSADDTDAATANACVHKGAELLRALDRTDFFRLFKSCALAHGFTEFGLIEPGTDLASFRYSNALVMYSWPAGAFLGIEGCFDPAADAVVCHLMRSTVARAFAPGVEAPSVSPLLMFGQRGHAALVPLVTPTSRRFGLVLLGRQAVPDDGDLATLSYEATSIFQRYFDAVLACDL